MTRQDRSEVSETRWLTKLPSMYNRQQIAINSENEQRRENEEKGNT